MNVILRGVAITLNHVTNTNPSSIISTARGRLAIAQLYPITTRIVTIGDVPIRILTLVTDRIYLVHISVENTDCITIPEIEFNLGPRTEEGDVFARG